MDVTSLYTNIPQEEGIETVCKAYNAFYKEETPISTEYIQRALKLILQENSFEFKDSLSTTMQRAPKRRFRGPRKPKVLRRHLKAVEICLHPSHPSVEWIEIFLWSCEIYQGSIGAVLI